MLQPYQYLVGKIADYVCPSISDGHFHFIKVLGNTLCVNETQIEYLDNGEIIVNYDNVKSVTPGQACVFYDGEKCLGGGIIKEVRYNNEKLWYLL